MKNAMAKETVILANLERNLLSDQIYSPLTPPQYISNRSIWEPGDAWNTVQNEEKDTWASFSSIDRTICLKPQL